MLRKRTRETKFAGIAPFSFGIQYVETDATEVQEGFDAHTHDEYEIYLNLSGDVEFMVENRVYPIRPGSVIITRPNEFHHCIYRDRTTVHRHFWILFSDPRVGTEEALLRRFDAREAGSDNLVDLEGSAFERVKEICFAMLEAQESAAERYRCFFELIACIERGGMAGGEIELSEDVRAALKYMEENIAFPMTMTDVAAAAHVSLNTLERHFFAAIHATPSEFLKQRRLSQAQVLLRSGASVQEAAQRSGFGDCSHFIALFRRAWGMTPLQYKKQFRPGENRR